MRYFITAIVRVHADSPEEAKEKAQIFLMRSKPEEIESFSVEMVADENGEEM